MRVLASFAMGVVMFAALTAPTMLPEPGWRPVVAISVIVSFVMGLWCASK